MRLLLIATASLLAACAPPVDTLPPLAAETPQQSLPDACGAAGLQVLVGQDVALFESQARTGPTRIIRPGQTVTMDYSPERLNVAVDGSDRITRISCG